MVSSGRKFSRGSNRSHDGSPTSIVQSTITSKSIFSPRFPKQERERSHSDEATESVENSQPQVVEGKKRGEKRMAKENKQEFEVLDSENRLKWSESMEVALATKDDLNCELAIKNKAIGFKDSNDRDSYETMRKKNKVNGFKDSSVQDSYEPVRKKNKEIGFEDSNVRDSYEPVRKKNKANWFEDSSA